MNPGPIFNPSLASRFLIILKSLNTNRTQVQAQLSHTRPIYFDMPTLAPSRTVRNVNITVGLSTEKSLHKKSVIFYLLLIPPLDFSCGSLGCSQGEEFLEAQCQ